ncbi:MAG: Lrp/AsnC ligand binding domain-containing protein [Candidatus Bathyarchaeota archaeon]
MHQEVEKVYVLIKVEPGKDFDVFSKIRDLQHKYPIQEISSVYGEFEIITKIQIASPADLEDFVMKTIRKIPGVKETVTLIVAKSVEFK